MNRFVALLGIMTVVLSAQGKDMAELKTRTATFAIDETGSLSAITGNNRNYLAPGQPAPVLQVRVAGKDCPPDRAVWDESTGLLTLSYSAAAAKAVVEIVAKPTHITLELVEATPLEKIDLVRWGDYPITINRVVGELVGVVRDTKFAVGIQALNARTQGGPPCGDDFQEHRYKSPDAVPHDGILKVSAAPMTHFGTVAKTTDFGSVLRMHCWEHANGEAFFKQTKRLPYAPAIPMPYPEETIIGTKIALFACPEPEALETLGKIELAEGLPHPMIDGKWIKTNPLSGPIPHLCFEFDENNIDEFIAVARACDIDWLYHSSPWQTWGHFPLKPGMFPRGMASLQDCMKKIHAAGMKLGTHTLSTFITADDAYVTMAGGNPDLVRTGGAGSSHVTIKYGAKRIYYGNRNLSAEIARNCARICNEAGLDQFCFDGLEANWSTGLGGYGRDLFMDEWYNALTPDVRKKMVVDGSNLDNYIWHMYYGVNYGEPWYGSFRKSMIDYRLDMIRLQARNYLIPMLGQFFIKPDANRVEDIEWLMALSTGYGAGFSLTFGRGSSSYLQGEPTSETARLRPPNLGDITSTIGTWQKARKARAFPEKIREMLQDETREFHLKSVSPHAWDLFALHTAPGVRNGEIHTDCPHAESGVWLVVINFSKQALKDYTCVVNGKRVLLAEELKAGQHLRYIGGPDIGDYGAGWKPLGKHVTALGEVRVQKGPVTVEFDWADRDNTPGDVYVELRLPGEAMRLTGTANDLNRYK